jgi:YesN/AraC family two-component response regulator
MFKVLLVDDEPIVRRALRTLLDWEKEGCKIIGEAYDGKEAISILNKEKADIIFTDMKMPIMNGLELINHVKENFSCIKFIALSAYDDFEMVSEAYKLGVKEYVLKSSLSSEALKEVVGNLKRQLIEEKDMEEKKRNEEKIRIKQMEEYGYMLDVIGMSGKAISDNLLKRLLFEEGSNKNEILRLCKRMGINLLRSKYIIAIMYASIKEEINIEKNESSEQASMKVGKIIDDTLNKYCCGVAYEEEKFKYVAIFNFDKQLQEGKILQLLKVIFDDIVQSIDAKMKYRISVGLSCVNSDIEILNVLYKQANLALDYTFILGRGRKVYYNQCKTMLSVPKENFSYRITKLKDCLEYKINLKREAIEKEICFRAADINLGQINEVGDIFKLYHAVIYEYVKANNFLLDTVKLLESFTNYLEKYGDLKELNAWLKEILFKIFDLRENSNNHINKAKLYINNNYSRNITLSDVATHLGYNPSYLSRLFSSETGLSFSEYLSKVRLEAAIKFLNETSLSVGEISHKIGYSNQENFSRFFKKAMNISPSSYRK